LLGASPLAAFWKTIVETRTGITTAVMTGFGRVVSEIGISLMLGGNIRGLTRTATTAIALETGQGNFPRAIALGILLLCLVLLINVAVQIGRRPEHV
jgi:tungstate transport system permease protein